MERDAVRLFMEAGGSAPAVVTVPDPASHLPMDVIGEIEDENKRKQRRVDGNLAAVPSGSPEIVEGRIGKALRFANEYHFVSLNGQGLVEHTEPMSVAAWVKVDAVGKIQAIIGNAGDKNEFWRGWDFYIDEQGRPAIKIISCIPHDMIEAHGQGIVKADEWSHVMFTYDGSGRAAGLRFYLDGKAIESEVTFDHLYKSILPVNNDATRTRQDKSLRIGKSYRSFTGEFGIYVGAIDEVRLYGKALTALEAAALVSGESAEPVAGETESSVSPADAAAHWLHRENESYRALADEAAALRGERLAVMQTVPEVMVMSEMATPRQMHVLFRGQYDLPRQPVDAGTPGSLPALQAGSPNDRRGLAKWLFEAENPLTSRVAVNRYWQMIFGRGLVSTPHDFGTQGARPTHPDLLDWLAVEFRESGWDVRHVVRLMVTSATYRQSSAHRPEAAERDPLNELLWRSPTYRLPAEFIRDHALAASGLLVKQVGGESVKPYQPDGLWEEKNNFSQILLTYKPDSGEKLYRRAMYTFIRRTSPHPAMIALDSPTRDVCTVKREITNTPLQALVLLNDPQFVEPARVLGERLTAEGGMTAEQRIEEAFRRLTGRRPSEAEMAALAGLYQAELERFRADGEAAAALLGAGAHPKMEGVDAAEAAAMTVVVNTLMNFDEFYMRR